MVWIQLWLANYDLLCCQWIKWCLLNCSDRKLYRKIISTKNAGETMTCSGSFKHLPYITLKAWSWVFVQTSHTHTHTPIKTQVCAEVRQLFVFIVFSPMCYCCYSFLPRVMLGKASHLGVKCSTCGLFTPATFCFLSQLHPFSVTPTCYRLHQCTN